MMNLVHLFGKEVKRMPENEIEPTGKGNSNKSIIFGFKFSSFLSVNTAFSTLRTLIPTEPKDRKLSKIETLRLASSYISHLGTQLLAGPIEQPCLRLSRKVDDSGSNRHQVCTFCIAHKKSPVILSSTYVNFKKKAVFFNFRKDLMTTNIIRISKDKLF